ncbi:hypothetical protein [Vibrio mexicanus]|uniref:hypothetical protein n=1 Tax=Vibrio mexicanus TaxID=1004326 RepID=UPI000AE6C97A|nr:hypothetical protein [Vibrio mexicanus]
MNKLRLPLKLLTIALASSMAMPTTALAATHHPQAEQLDLLWKVIDHNIGENKFLGSLTITNNGSEALGESGWSLYYSSVRPPASVLPLDSEDGNLARAEIAAQNLVLKNADTSKSGDYFVLEPISGFEPIYPGNLAKYLLQLSIGKC